MTDKEKLAIAVSALEDITRCIASLIQLGEVTKDEALKAFADTTVTIARVSESAQAQIRLQ